MNADRAIIGKYVVVSPVKDEEAYLDTTICAVLNQTVRPIKWIIVDDASQDRTPKILSNYAQQFDWFVPVRINRNTGRKLGSAEIRAFAQGYELLREEQFDFIVKLDTDLDLPRNYFEQLLMEFHKNEKLGIASGVYLEKRGGQWHPVEMPEYHAAGAARMVRRECFREIGGFPLLPGWDTADEIKAQARGWQTRHFPEIQFRHLRSEGSALGRPRTHILHGEVYYVCGGGTLFFFLKLLHRSLFGKPFLLGGLLLLFGYLRARATRRSKLVSQSEADFYRKLLNQRMCQQLGKHLRLWEQQ